MPLWQAPPSGGAAPRGSAEAPKEAREQGAGDFAEAAVEAIAQLLDMGGDGDGSASPGAMSQDEVAYTPSAMDADDPHSHSKVGWPLFPEAVPVMPVACMPHAMDANTPTATKRWAAILV